MEKKKKGINVKVKVREPAEVVVLGELWQSCVFKLG